MKTPIGRCLRSEREAEFLPTSEHRAIVYKSKLKRYQPLWELFLGTEEHADFPPVSVKTQRGHFQI